MDARTTFKLLFAVCVGLTPVKGDWALMQWVWFSPTHPAAFAYLYNEFLVVLMCVCVYGRVSVGAKRIDLIFEYSKWILKAKPEDGLRVTNYGVFSQLDYKGARFVQMSKQWACSCQVYCVCTCRICSVDFWHESTNLILDVGGPCHPVFSVHCITHTCTRPVVIISPSLALDTMSILRLLIITHNMF